VAMPQREGEHAHATDREPGSTHAPLKRRKSTRTRQRERGGGALRGRQETEGRTHRRGRSPPHAVDPQEEESNESRAEVRPRVATSKKRTVA